MYPFYRYVCLTDTNMHFNLIWISVTGDYSNAKWNWHLTIQDLNLTSDQLWQNKLEVIFLQHCTSATLDMQQ